MGNKMPNGNVIVGARGEYNRFDGGVHKYKFEKTKTALCYRPGNQVEDAHLGRDPSFGSPVFGKTRLDCRNSGGPGDRYHLPQRARANGSAGKIITEVA